MAPPHHFAAHYDAQGNNIATVDYGSARTKENSLLYKWFPKAKDLLVPIWHEARFEINYRNEQGSLPSIGHGVAGRYFRLKNGRGFRSGSAPA